MRKESEGLTTSGTFLWSIVTQIFINSQPSHGGERKYNDFNFTNRNPRFSSTLYQGKQLKEMYFMCRCCWNVVTYKTPCVTVKYFTRIAGKTVEREQPR
jgi:hypothetical protein